MTHPYPPSGWSISYSSSEWNPFDNPHSNSGGLFWHSTSSIVLKDFSCTEGLSEHTSCFIFNHFGMLLSFALDKMSGFMTTWNHSEWLLSISDVSATCQMDAIPHSHFQGEQRGCPRINTNSTEVIEINTNKQIVLFLYLSLCYLFSKFAGCYNYSSRLYFLSTKHMERKRMFQKECIRKFVWCPPTLMLILEIVLKIFCSFKKLSIFTIQYNTMLWYF